MGINDTICLLLGAIWKLEEVKWGGWTGFDVIHDQPLKFLLLWLVWMLQGDSHLSKTLLLLVLENDRLIQGLRLGMLVRTTSSWSVDPLSIYPGMLTISADLLRLTVASVHLRSAVDRVPRHLERFYFPCGCVIHGCQPCTGSIVTVVWWVLVVNVGLQTLINHLDFAFSDSFVWKKFL